MNKIWEFFENMNEFLYVSDMDTYEIVYMNKKSLDAFGISSIDEIKNKKCHEILQNCYTPCSLCKNKDLRPGEFIEWTYYNPAINKHLSLKDTMVKDGEKKYRITLAIEKTDFEPQSNKINNYQDMCAIVNEGIKLALQNPNPDKTIDIILEYLGTALHAERTYIFEQRPNLHNDNTYEWVAKGITPEKDNLQDVLAEACENWYTAFKQQESVIIGNIEDIKKENQLQYDILKSQNINSIVVAPLYDKKKIIGFYGVDNPPAEYLEYSSSLLQIVGHFMESTIRRRNLLVQLKLAGYTDYLTKLGNRHAMNDYIQNYMPDNQSIGIIYCDITGLKQVNDTEGHAAGDKLILDACACMKRVFKHNTLFRIGGDEFLYLCPNITEDKLKQLEQKLKDDISKHSVNMAIGRCWCENSSHNLDKAISQAEKAMYQDKLDYYDKQGR